MIRFAAMFLALFATNTLVTPVPANAQQCALPIEKSRTGINYQQRGNRCEGDFREQVSGRVNLRILGFHANATNLGDPNSEKVVLKPMQFRPSGDGLLKFVSTRLGENYQMDTSQFSSDGNFEWDLAVLKQVNPPLRRFNLAGYYCSSNCDAGQNAKPTLHPVRFPERSGSRTTIRPRLIIKADTGLATLEVVFTTASGDQLRSPVRKNIQAGQATTQYLPQDLSGEFCDIQIRAVASSGLQDRISARLMLPET